MWVGFADLSAALDSLHFFVEDRSGLPYLWVGLVAVIALGHCGWGRLDVPTVVVGHSGIESRIHSVAGAVNLTYNPAAATGIVRLE